jgi:hypothetical protein
MQCDNNLLFIGSVLASVTIGSASVTSAVFDLSTGLMTNSSTYGPDPVGGGLFLLASTLSYGEDLGPGGFRLRGTALLSSAFAPNSTSGTNVVVAWQGASDPYAGGSISTPAFASLTWNTYAQTGPIPLADLKTNTAIVLPDFADRMVDTNLPRFLRLAFIPSGTFSSLTIVNANVNVQRPDGYCGDYPGGFVVAP